MRARVAAIAIVALGLAAAAWLLWPAAAPPPPSPRVEQRDEDEPRPRRVAPAPVAARKGEVACDVGSALEGRRCSVRTGPPDWPLVTTVPGDYDGAVFRFRPRAPAGRGDLVCAGVEDPVPLRWNGAGECLVTGELPTAADAPLFGRVDGADDLPDGTVFLEGCGAAADDPVDADGGFFVLTNPGPCSMRAWRRAGKLKLQGPWVEALAVSGVEVEVALSVPTFEPAGLGVRVRSGAEGVEVTAVFEGSPAAAAGLEAGDVLTTIDGVPVDGMGPDEFMELGMGPAGSTVHVEGMDEEGEPFDATIRRAVIPQEE